MTSTALAPYIESVVTQASSFDNCISLIDQMLTDIAATRTAITASGDLNDPITAQERERVAGLAKRVTSIASSKDFSRASYHIAIGKLSKPLEKVCVSQTKSRSRVSVKKTNASLRSSTWRMRFGRLFQRTALMH
jgi:hypothetical protein